MPNIGSPAQPATPATRRAGRRVERAERWLLSSTAARHRLRANGAEDQAERDLAAFWQARDWTLSPADQAYLAEVAALVSSGAVVASGRSLSDPPFAPIYRVASKEVALLGQKLTAGQFFAFDYRNGRLLSLKAHDGVPD